MAKSRVTVEIDEAKIRREFGASLKRAQAILDTQVLKDTDPYVPMVTGTLRNSGITGSDIGSGTLRWAAPYAAKQYYTSPNKTTAEHPKATMFWFEAAKAAMKDAWIRVAKKAGGAR